MKKTAVLLALILLVGAGLRASYLREIVHAPDFASPLADPAFHDYWARALVGGDWTPPAGENDPRIREVPFQRPPGYPYFLAAVYAMTGGSHVGARVAQMALGLANCLLAFLLGRALFSRSVGLVGAALCATYWIFPYYEGELHAPVLIATLNLAALLALVLWTQRPAKVRALLLGLIVGAGALIQANALLFAPLGAAWIAWDGRRLVSASPFSPFKHALVFLLGVTLAIAPATVRNWVVTDPHDFVPLASNGAINLYIGNNDIADGVSVKIPNLQELAWMNAWSWFSYDRIVAGVSLHEGRPLKYSEASRYFTNRALEFIRENPGKFLQLCVKRAALFWGPDEVSNNKAVQIDKDKSGTLSRLPAFPWFFSLALVGAGALVLEERRASSKKPRADVATWRRVALTGVGVFLLAYFLSFVPFLAAARFRAPILPIVFLFSAFALVRAFELVRRGNWKNVGIALSAWVILLLASRHSFFESGPDEAWWHTDRAAALVQEGKMQEAVLELQEALRANPGYVDAHVNLGGLLAEMGRSDEAIAHFREVITHRPDRADVRLRLGALLLQASRFDDAAKELEEVARANPESAPAHFEFGRALVETKRDSEGIAALRRSLELDPKQPAAHVNIGIALARTGDPAGARAEFEKALEIDASTANARFQLGRLAESAGRLEEAEKEYQEAFRLNPESVEAPITIGNLYLQGKKYDDAERWYKRAIGIDPRNMTARCNLAGALANEGKYLDAVKELEEALTIDPKHAIANERLAALRAYLAQSTPAG